MKTLYAFIAITATAALTTDPVLAQVLGGGIGGSMRNTFGGALSGSMMERHGTMDERFGSSHSLSSNDGLGVQPNVSRPTVPANPAAGRAVENGKQTAERTAQTATAKAQSGRSTAQNGGAAAIQDGHAAASEVNSARTEAASTVPKTPAAPSGAAVQAPQSDAGLRAPATQVTGDGSASSNTHAKRDAGGLSANSQTSTGADTSASLER